MYRSILATLICLTAAFPTWARAADPMENALAAIPEDAVGFLCVPSLKQLDGDWQQAVSNFGLQPLVPPPWNSPLAALQQFMQLSAGLDANGPLVLVQMPFNPPSEFMGSKQAFILPAADPKALVEAMGGQAGEGGIWNVKLLGGPAFAMTGEKRLIVSTSAEVVKAVAGGKTGTGTKFKGKNPKMYEGLDLVLWLDGERLLKAFKPQIDGFLAIVTMAQAASGPLGVKQAESTKKQISMLVDGTQSLMLGVSLDPAGVGLRLAIHAKAGSELAQQTKAKPAAGSLLQGLPAGRYMLAFGQVFDADLLKESLKDLDPYFEAGKGVESVNAEQLGILKGILQDWAPLNKAARLTVEALPPGPNGVIGMSLIFETSDTQRWLELVGKAVEALKKLPTDKDAKMFADAASYSAEAEDVAGVKVSHLKLDLSKIEEIDEDDLEEVTKVVGEEGVLFRLAPAGANVVTVSFGGGADYMKRLIEHAGREAAPLDNTPGIQKVANHLPKKQVGAAYIAVDQILACVSTIAKVLEEDEPLPFQMPEINAPLGVTVTGEQELMLIDVFCPTELIAASKNVVMTMMGPGGPGTAQPPPAGPR
ncbi:MAG: hypothetical protein V2A79_03925 [Planctomycetota bacterium]